MRPRNHHKPTIHSHIDIHSLYTHALTTYSHTHHSITTQSLNDHGFTTHSPYTPPSPRSLPTHPLSHTINSSPTEHTHHVFTHHMHTHHSSLQTVVTTLTHLPFNHVPNTHALNKQSRTPQTLMLPPFTHTLIIHPCIQRAPTMHSRTHHALLTNPPCAHSLTVTVTVTHSLTHSLTHYILSHPPRTHHAIT